MANSTSEYRLWGLQNGVTSLNGYPNAVKSLLLGDTNLNNEFQGERTEGMEKFLQVWYRQAITETGLQFFLCSLLLHFFFLLSSCFCSLLHLIIIFFCYLENVIL